MLRLNRAAQDFLRSYENEAANTDKAARLLGAEVERVVRDSGAFVHVVTARAKSLDSIRSKLRRKQYARPLARLTDLIGVRVITYYRDAVDPIVARLLQAFEINRRHSIDKRLALGLREFGYRSVHVIARLRPSQLISLDGRAIRKRWFEIQVRSIVEHAWAEIEHEIVYKSGIELPDVDRRRFARLAGTLELLDTEFLALRNRRSELIDEYRGAYERRMDFRVIFDVARLWGFLEAFRPKGQSWRKSVAEGVPINPALDVSCLEALKAVGIGTAASFVNVVTSRQFRRAESSFASDQGISPERLSHVAVVVLAVAVKNLSTVNRHFPEFLNDPALAPILRARRRREAPVRALPTGL